LKSSLDFGQPLMPHDFFPHDYSPYGLDESGQTFPLTPRERQLLEAYALGLSNQETARRLGLSVRTMQTYSSNLLKKLGVNNRQKALRRAISLGFNAVIRRFDHPE
jgi:DNA-binding NarL/FixJ family response regulator